METVEVNIIRSYRESLVLKCYCYCDVVVVCRYSTLSLFN
jgi:hypothetical protein